MKKRKINTKQLTQVKPILRHGKKRFYFRYYCPDLQKDGLTDSLVAMGYRENEDFVIGIRFWLGDVDHIYTLAQNMVEEGVDILFCVGKNRWMRL